MAYLKEIFNCELALIFFYQRKFKFLHKICVSDFLE